MNNLIKTFREIEMSQFKTLDFLSYLPTMIWDHQGPLIQNLASDVFVYGVYYFIKNFPVGYSSLRYDGLKILVILAISLEHNFIFEKFLTFGK